MEDFNEKVAGSMIEISLIIKKSAEIIKENGEVSFLIKELQQIKENNYRVFVFGAGRSGLVGRAFAMRLMHLGYQSFFIGDTTTPAIDSHDLVIVISGSGETKTVVSYVEIILRYIKAKVFAITSNPESTLVRLVDENCAINLPGREDLSIVEDYEVRRIRGTLPSAPLGTQFEISALVFLDSVVRELMEILGITEKEMKEKHAVE